MLAAIGQRSQSARIQMASSRSPANVTSISEPRRVLAKVTTPALVQRRAGAGADGRDGATACGGPLAGIAVGPVNSYWGEHPIAQFPNLAIIIADAPWFDTRGNGSG